MRDEAYLYDLFPLEHTPLRPYPRKDHIYESIYASMWQAFMHKEPDSYEDPREINFADVMTDFGYRIEHRHAKVVASVVCWFGTNCGSAFLRECETLGEHIPKRNFGDRYFLGWQMENSRRCYMNGGNRCLELIATSALPLKVDDYEAVDCLMNWLGTVRGQIFLKMAHDECESAMVKERIRAHAEWTRIREEMRSPNGS